MKLIKLYSLALLAISISLVSCSDGEDGINGTDGIDGIDGQNGIDGQDGADGQNGADGQHGQNGVGYDELAQYGYITMTLAGTRPDEIAFEVTDTFRFTPLDGDSSDGLNTIFFENLPNNTLHHYFELYRFLTVPGDNYNESAMGFQLEYLNLGLEGELMLGASMNINDYAIIGDDNKFFVMTESFESGANGTSEFELTNLVFDSEDNNHLTFSYSFTVAANANSSGHELAVSGDVDVYLLELIP